MGSAPPVGLGLPLALALLDRAVSLSLQFSSQGRCKLLSCPGFWLRPRSLTQRFPRFLLQQRGTGLASWWF